MYKSNYDKYPATPMEGIVWKGWENICNQLKSSLSAESCVLVIECYQGVLHDELRGGDEVFRFAVIEPDGVDDFLELGMVAWARAAGSGQRRKSSGVTGSRACPCIGRRAP